MYAIFSNEAKLGRILIMIKSNTLIVKMNLINKLFFVLGRNWTIQNSKYCSETWTAALEECRRKYDYTAAKSPKVRIPLKPFGIDDASITIFKFLQIPFMLLQKYH